jgi:hypothetical protein
VARVTYPMECVADRMGSSRRRSRPIRSASHSGSIKSSIVIGDGVGLALAVIVRLPALAIFFLGRCEPDTGSSIITTGQDPLSVASLRLSTTEPSDVKHPQMLGLTYARSIDSCGRRPVGPAPRWTRTAQLKRADLADKRVRHSAQNGLANSWRSS